MTGKQTTFLELQTNAEGDMGFYPGNWETKSLFTHGFQNILL